LKRFQGLGSFNGKDDSFDLYAGGRIWIRTSTDPESVIGIQGVKGVWLDEAGRMPRQFFWNIESRLGRMGGVLLITSTPYALNWLSDLVKRSEKGDKEILYSRWPSWENPTYPREEFDRLKQLLPAQVFRRRLEGYHEKLEGLIFDFSEDNTVDPKLTDLNGVQYVGGVDWGFNHPLAITVRAVKNKECYTVSIFKKSGLSAMQQLDLIEAKHRLYQVKAWSCGSDRPDMIAELNIRKVPAHKYFEFQPNYREVNAGNQKHAELITTKRYKVLRGIEQFDDLMEEYNTYAWRETKEGEESEKPTEINDDLMDAERYCTIACLHLFKDPVLKFPIPLLANRSIDTWKPGVKPISTDAY
jgi:hypothetical protein